MKLQYMCLDSALDLWPPGHFALGFFASRIGRLEMECSALGFSYVSWKPRNGQLAKLGSFHQSKRSHNKWYAVKVRWIIFIENLTYRFIPWSGRKYSHTNSYRHDCFCARWPSHSWSLGRLWVHQRNGALFHQISYHDSRREIEERVSGIARWI